MPERRRPPPPIVLADLKAFVSPFVQCPINGLMANARRRRDVLHFETQIQRQSRYISPPSSRETHGDGFLCPSHARAGTVDQLDLSYRPFDIFQNREERVARVA